MIRILRWAGSSLASCGVFFSVVFAIPEWLYFSYRFHAVGLLTANSAIFLAVLGCFAGAIVGVLVWWTILGPLQIKIEKLRNLRAGASAPQPLKQDGT